MIRLKKPDGRTDHGVFEEQLSAYLDGQLLPNEQEALEKHLDTCQVCQWNLDTLQQTIQWTRELEPLTVPRVFTIPAPAEPGRALGRRWNLAPVLQAATALVALLLFFAVAGDFWLSGFRGAAVPDGWSAYEEAPAPMAATDRVVIEATAPVAVEAPAAEQPREAPGEELIVVETVVVEAEIAVEAEAEQVPEPLAETAIATDAAKVGAAAPSEAAEEGIMAAEAPPELEVAQAEEAQATAEPQVDEDLSGATAEATGAGEPTLEAEGTPLALLAEPPEEQMLPQIGESQRTTPGEPESLQSSGRTGLAPNWLRLAEYTLGALFVALTLALLVVSFHRRRTR
jgi:hypothetical protein